MSSIPPELRNLTPIALSLRAAIVGPVTAYIAFVLELTLVPLLLPAMQLDFSLSISELTWVFNSYGIAVAVGVLVGGWFGDAFNTVKVFMLGVAVFAAGSLLLPAAEGYLTLVLGRALQGFGAGIFSPLVPLLLTRASPEKPGRALIVWGSAAGYVAAVAPLLYSRFDGGFAWKIAFVIIAVMAAIALLGLSRMHAIEDPADNAQKKADYTKLFRVGDLWVTFVYVFCTYGAITFYLFRAPVWLSSNEVKVAGMGLVMTVLWLTFSGLSALLRNIVDRPHLRLIMLAAPVLISAGLPLLFYGQGVMLSVFSAVLVGAGLACSNAPSTQLVLRFAPQGMSGIATSLDITFARLGGIMTVSVLTEMESAYSALAICLSCLIAAFCALVANRGIAAG